MYGKLISTQGNVVKIQLDEELDINKLIKFANGKQPTVELLVDDGRHITPDQRKKIYALLGDYCLYTGYSLNEAKLFFKSMVADFFHTEMFSLSDCSETVASQMITTMLEFFFFEDIPFHTKIWDSLPDDFPRVMMCIKTKRCAICLKEHADIHHVTAVGMGRNRNEINHVGMYIEPLCRVHHMIFHTIGAKNFMAKYHIKPIKVTPEIAKELHLGKQKSEELKNAE